jgi:CBS domain-containing protein
VIDGGEQARWWRNHFATESKLLDLVTAPGVHSKWKRKEVDVARAKDVMTTDLVMIDETATIAEALAQMQEQHVRALIVAQRTAEDAYGILTNTDIVYSVVAQGSDPMTVRVSELMTKPCVTVHPDLTVEHIARLFSYLHIHHAPVMGDQLVGLVSVSDLLRPTIDA